MAVIIRKESEICCNRYSSIIGVCSKNIKVDSMNKKIVIATMGSRGDVEPYIALGIELKKIGYDEAS